MDPKEISSSTQEESTGERLYAACSRERLAAAPGGSAGDGLLAWGGPHHAGGGRPPPSCLPKHHTRAQAHGGRQGKQSAQDPLCWH